MHTHMLSSYNILYKTRKSLLCVWHKGAAFLSSWWNQNVKIHKRSQNASCRENHSMKAGGKCLSVYFKPLFKCLVHDSQQTSGWKRQQAEPVTDIKSWKTVLLDCPAVGSRITRVLFWGSMALLFIFMSICAYR